VEEKRGFLPGEKKDIVVFVLWKILFQVAKKSGVVYQERGEKKLRLLKESFGSKEKEKFAFIKKGSALRWREKKKGEQSGILLEDAGCDEEKEVRRELGGKGGSLSTHQGTKGKGGKKGKKHGLSFVHSQSGWKRFSCNWGGTKESK